MTDRGADLVTLGRRVRHFRVQQGLTLAELAEAVGVAPSQLSMVENGRREPRLSLLTALAERLAIPVGDLLAPEPPTRRAALEIALENAQRRPGYAALGLPTVRASRSLPTPVLESLVGLHAELERRDSAAIATPEEARRANAELRIWIREIDNSLPELDTAAEELIRAAGYTVGAVTHSTVARAARRLGFEIIHVDDLPHSTRTVTDRANGRIYLPPASIPGGLGLRSLALQAIAHHVLGHEQPTDYGQFLRQRLEINYFALAALMPLTSAVGTLEKAKKDKDLAIEDFRDAFGVTHEAAARRFTNLATAHLGLTVHSLRVSANGSLYRGYENDGLPLRTDPIGAIEGQPICRHWAARAAFATTDRTAEFHQYTDTPVGTFWCSTQTGTTTSGEFSITVGVPFAHATWFRGRTTSRRVASTCPSPECCQLPPPELAERWSGAAWPSARLHAQILAPLPRGTFPGVEDREVYEFLERHSTAPSR